jgi:GT2 family glycosyltransferase
VQDQAQMTVAVVIVNWNSGELLSRCLQSIETQQRRPDHIVLVDNASTDDSIDRLGRTALRDVQVIRLPRNVGFAAANNVAARAADRFDLLALLNPDAFAEPGWLAALVEAAERTPDAAAFASRMLLDSSPQYLDGAGDSYHGSGRAWRNGHRLAADQYGVSDSEVFAACAAAALYRRAAFDDVSGFDERFFCYFEDVDLGFRLRLRGFRSIYVHSAAVRHVSSAISGYRGNFAVYHGERNLVWTFFKNMPGPLLWWYLPQHLVMNVAALIHYAGRGQGSVVLKAKLDALRGLPSVLRQRRLIQQSRTIDAWRLRRVFARGVLAPYRTRRGQ